MFMDNYLSLYMLPEFAMPKPIGFYLKELDGLITGAMAEVFAKRGLQRRHWQVLATLPDTPDSVSVGLAPFWTEEAITLTEVLDDLSGLVTVGELIELTDEGRVVRDELEEGVRGVRERVMAGLTGEDYERCVATLERMCANLT